jgi:hypothetical protein
MHARLALATALAALALPAPALAATPESGALSVEKPQVKWSGYAAGGTVNVIAPIRDRTCEQPFCDRFRLTVPEGLPQGTRLRFDITAQQATGYVDLFITSPDGVKQRYNTGSGEPNLVAELDEFDPGQYLLEIYTNVLYVPGLTEGPYSGRARLLLPLPPAA